MNAVEIIEAQTSATVIESQIPSTPKSSGRISTESDWQIMVRRKDIAADTPPLLSAVKKDDAKILYPASRNAGENIRKACFVRSKSSLSYPTKIPEKTPARAKASPNIAIPVPAIRRMLFFSRLLSSARFSAPK